VLIWHLRGETRARDLLCQLQHEGAFDLLIGAMQRAEVVFFLREAEKTQTLLFLSQFQTAPVDQAIVDRAGEIYRRWHPSHGIDVNDTILAATVKQSGGRIYTLNVKHYPMPEIQALRAWEV